MKKESDTSKKVTRREVLGSAAALAALTVVPSGVLGASSSESESKPNSVFDGVHIGTITYSYRGIDGSAEGTLNALLQCGLSEVELMGGPIQSYLGIGGGGGRGGAFGGRGQQRGQMPEGMAARGGFDPNAMRGQMGARGAFDPNAMRGRGARGQMGEGMAARGAFDPNAMRGRGQMGEGMAARGNRAGGGRGQQTPPEPLTAEELQTLNAERYIQLGKALDMRKMYNDAGVNIHIHKMNFGQRDEDIDFNFQVAKALGCVGITLERSEAMAERLAPFAEKHKIWVAFHNHTNNYPQLEPDDPILDYGEWIGFNFDAGHYFAGSGGKDPREIIEKYHDRIVSVHLKDRTADGGNLPWGQGDTPIAGILRLIRDEKWPIYCDIELEYRVPEGSDSVQEVAKCVQYCKDALLG